MGLGSMTSREGLDERRRDAVSSRASPAEWRSSLREGFVRLAPSRVTSRFAMQPETRSLPSRRLPLIRPISIAMPGREIFRGSIVAWMLIVRRSKERAAVGFVKTAIARNCRNRPEPIAAAGTRALDPEPATAPLVVFQAGR